MEADWAFFYYTLLSSVMFVCGFYIGKSRANLLSWDILDLTFDFVTERITRHTFITELNIIADRLLGRKDGTRKQRG